MIGPFSSSFKRVRAFKFNNLKRSSNFSIPSYMFSKQIRSQKVSLKTGYSGKYDGAILFEFTTAENRI